MINFNYVGKTNVESLIKKVGQIKDWNKYQFRQKTFDVHKHTKTIPLIFNEDFRLKDPTYHTHYDKYKKEIEKFKTIFSKKFGKGYIIRAILVNLLSEKSIPQHIDNGDSLHFCKRVHIPIITNKKVYFSVGEEKKNLKSGEMWEINNSKKSHAVKNNSKEDRINLIIDWIVE